jgi:hypothetical protein
MKSKVLLLRYGRAALLIAALLSLTAAPAFAQEIDIKRTCGL